jgi:hypothetical protein
MPILEALKLSTVRMPILYVKWQFCNDFVMACGSSRSRLGQKTVTGPALL